MKPQTMKTKLMVSLLALGSTLMFLTLCMAEDSDPGIPPGPEMQADAQPIPNLPYTINQSGSYYLTQNLRHSNRNTNAIEVNADNVTIDLAGYSIIGPSSDSGTSNGIHMNGRTNVEIRNGTVTGFGGNGIYEENNDVGSGHRIIAIRAMSNGGHGIMLWGSNHIVKDCTATQNCFALTSGGYGAITCGPACTVIGNVASGNYIIGISTGSGCLICDNAVSSNYYGILPWYGCSVINNTISYNGADGVRVEKDGNLVKSNTLLANAQNGINVLGSYNAIEQNLVTYSDVGIDFGSAQNVYANNRALNNKTNYGGSVPTGAGNGGGNIGFGTLASHNVNAMLGMYEFQTMINSAAFD